MSSNEAIFGVWGSLQIALTGWGYAPFHIIAHISCLIVFAIIFNKLQSGNQSDSQRLLTLLCLIEILYCVAQIIRVLVDVNIIPMNLVSQYISSAASTGLFSVLLWVLFHFSIFDLKAKKLVPNNFKFNFITAIPMLINVILLSTSPIHGLYLNLRGSTMTFGRLINLKIIADLLYPLTGALLVISKRRLMTRYERENMSVVSFLAIFLMCFAPLQLFNWKFPFLCYVILITSIVIYMNYADSLVSLDPVTRIPNRNAVLLHLFERLKSGVDLDKLYVFLVDVEDLWDINDRYGRAEGDRALKIVTDGLNKFKENEHKCYISRYASCEFIIIADINNRNERDLFIEHIRNYVINSAMHAGAKYIIHVNIGWSHYEQFSRSETVLGLIEEADHMMNENKEQKKFDDLWQSSFHAEN